MTADDDEIVTSYPPGAVVDLGEIGPERLAEWCAVLIAEALDGLGEPDETYPAPLVRVVAVLREALVLANRASGS